MRHLHLKMTNLLAETLDILKENSKLPYDVHYIITDREMGEGMTWDQYADYAKNIEYDNGFGLNFISMDLMIVGDEWWLERHEYDGSERWKFKSKPEPPMEIVEIGKIMRSIMDNEVPRRNKDIFSELNQGLLRFY